MIHSLKIKKEFFEPVDLGYKQFEIRLNDRDYREGDYLALNEIDDAGEYTRRSVLVYVDYILDNSDYCKEGYIVMSIKKCRITCEDYLIRGR